MEWIVTRREQPNLSPMVIKAAGCRVSKYTTRGNFPMTAWKAVFDDGKEARGMKTADEAMRYAEYQLTAETPSK